MLTGGAEPAGSGTSADEGAVELVHGDARVPVDERADDQLPGDDAHVAQHAVALGHELAPAGGSVARVQGIATMRPLRRRRVVIAT